MSWRAHFTNAPQHSLTTSTSNKSRTDPKTFHYPRVSIYKTRKASKKKLQSERHYVGGELPTGETKAGKGERKQAQMNHEVHVGSDRGVLHLKQSHRANSLMKLFLSSQKLDACGAVRREFTRRIDVGGDTEKCATAKCAASEQNIVETKQRETRQAQDRPGSQLPTGNV